MTVQIGTSVAQKHWKLCGQERVTKLMVVGIKDWNAVEEPHIQ